MDRAHIRSLEKSVLPAVQTNSSRIHAPTAYFDVEEDVKISTEISRCPRKDEIWPTLYRENNFHIGFRVCGNSKPHNYRSMCIRFIIFSCRFRWISNNITISESVKALASLKSVDGNIGLYIKDVKHICDIKASKDTVTVQNNSIIEAQALKVNTRVNHKEYLRESIPSLYFLQAQKHQRCWRRTERLALCFRRPQCQDPSVGKSLI